MSKRTAKSKRFQRTLEDAKYALDSIGIPFHLHFGTALGAAREHDFIKHDHDIDLAVFYDDVNKESQVKEIENAMYDAGFDVMNRLGKLDRGKEIQFRHYKTDVPLDIIWIAKSKYRGNPYYIYGLYFGMCDDYPHEMCVYSMSPYKTKPTTFHGVQYQTIPNTTLVDLYGKDWKIPKKYTYEQGLSEGFKGFLPDYFSLKTVDVKVAYCFLLYDTIKHRKVWETFFNQDRYPEKSYNVYTHLKEITDKTPGLKRIK